MELHNEAPLATVSEHLLGEVRGPEHRLLHILEIGQGGGFPGDDGLGKVQIAQDGGEQVVEIVGDARAMPPANTPRLSSFWA